MNFFRSFIFLFLPILLLSCSRPPSVKESKQMLIEKVNTISLCFLISGLVYIFLPYVMPKVAETLVNFFKEKLKIKPKDLILIVLITISCFYFCIIFYSFSNGKLTDINKITVLIFLVAGILPTYNLIESIKLEDKILRKSSIQKLVQYLFFIIVMFIGMEIIFGDIANLTMIYSK